MIRYRVTISSRAMRQIERASAWWRTHRDKNPFAFDQDLDDAFRSIRSNPHVGSPVRARRVGVRSLWLDRIGYFVYYRERANHFVEILAIWHAARGSRPKL